MSKPDAINVTGYALHVLMDNYTDEIFDNAVWFTCTVCHEDSLVRFHGDVTYDKPVHGRCCKTNYSVTVPKELKFNV